MKNIINKINLKEASPLINAIIKHDHSLVKFIIREDPLQLNKVDSIFRISPIMLFLYYDYPISYMNHEDINYRHIDRFGNNVFHYCQNEDKINYCLKKIEKNIILNKSNINISNKNKIFNEILKDKSIVIDNSFLLIKNDIESHNNLVSLIKSFNIKSRNGVKLVITKSLKDDLFHFELFNYLKILSSYSLKPYQLIRIIDAYSKSENKLDVDYFENLKKLLLLIEKKHPVDLFLIKLFNSKNDKNILREFDNVLKSIDEFVLESIPNKMTSFKSFITSLIWVKCKINCSDVYRLDLKKRLYKPKNALMKIDKSLVGKKYKVLVAKNSYELLNWTSDLINCLYTLRDVFDQREVVIIGIQDVKTNEIKYAVEVKDNIVTRFLGHRNKQVDENNPIFLEVYDLLYQRKIIKYPYVRELKYKKREEFFLNIYEYIQYAVFALLYAATIFLLPLILFSIPVIVSFYLLSSLVNISESKDI